MKMMNFAACASSLSGGASYTKNATDFIPKVMDFILKIMDFRLAGLWLGLVVSNVFRTFALGFLLFTQDWAEVCI